jgi:hypothetical protein
MEDRTSTRITRVIEHTFKFSPHLHQLKALQYLLDKKQDTILYAPTNAGKSLIAQAYPLLRLDIMYNPSYLTWRGASQQACLPS